MMDRIDELLRELLEQDRLNRHYHQAALRPGEQRQAHLRMEKERGARRDAIRRQIADEWREMVELTRAVAREPYPDSDLESLLETLRIQAHTILARVKGEHND